MLLERCAFFSGLGVACYREIAMHMCLPYACKPLLACLACACVFGMLALQEHQSVAVCLVRMHTVAPPGHRIFSHSRVMQTHDRG